MVRSAWVSRVHAPEWTVQMPFSEAVDWSFISTQSPSTSVTPSTVLPNPDRVWLLLEAARTVKSAAGEVFPPPAKNATLVSALLAGNVPEDEWKATGHDHHVPLSVPLPVIVYRAHLSLLMRSCR